ncbi:Hypothetical_protein [Hexamita inflata]|uniref:Hypothetical_protein n=1 Tax=Hexamita inflata TaxID=28002 RepID=A0AA86N4P4_9EUKA|nr:Hypothetical protein HINF_LOCUS445 [Hexamita inflata]
MMRNTGCSQTNGDRGQFDPDDLSIPFLLSDIRNQIYTSSKLDLELKLNSLQNLLDDEISFNYFDYLVLKIIFFKRFEPENGEIQTLKTKAEIILNEFEAKNGGNAKFLTILEEKKRLL